MNELMNVDVEEDELEVSQSKMHTLKGKELAVARRAAYMRTLDEMYQDTYGGWLEKQDAEKKERIRKKSLHMSHGLTHTAVLQCKGPAKCPFYAACPIPKVGQTTIPPMDEFPINNGCVLEVSYMGQRLMYYMDFLEVDPFNTVEMSLIDELALLDLLKNRATLVLANGDKRGQGRDLLSVDVAVVGFSKDGQALTSEVTKAHPMIDILERHERRRLKILEKFNATRESRLKVLGTDVGAQSKLQQDIMDIKSFVESAVKKGMVLSTQDNAVVLADKSHKPYTPDPLELL